MPAPRILLSLAGRSLRRRGPLIAAAAVVSVAAVSIGTSLTAPAGAVEYVKSATVARTDFGGSPTTSGWGAPAVGGGWRYDAGSTFSTDGATGDIGLKAPGTSATAALDSVRSGDVEAGATVAISSLPKNGAAYAGVEVRKVGSTYYLAQLRVTASGTASIAVLRVNGSTASQAYVAKDAGAVRDISDGQRVSIQTRITGTDPVTVQARAWKTGSAQPAWQASSNDSTDLRIRAAGSVALWSYSSRVSGVTGFSWDDLLVDGLTTTPTTPPGTPSSTPTTTPTTTPTPTTPPTTTPTTPPVTTPPDDGGASDPTVDTSGTRNPVGAAKIGSTSYAVPAGAVFAKPSGTSGNGSSGAPIVGLQKAIDAAPSGSTVVARGGVYHETVTIPAGKRITLQSAPGEAAWLDGSSDVSGFARDGRGWSAGGWTTKFDASPTYTRGAPDGSDAFGFIDPAFPMAAHPDQVWIDGVAQTQVASAAQLSAGKFFVDYGAQKLSLGSDPTGHDVRASSLVRALTVAGSGSVIRGIGIHRYAPSVPDMGAMVVTGSGVTVENVSITDNATQGLSMESTGGVLNHVTTSRNGLLGTHANYADGLKVSGMLSTDNNTEHFNRAPVSGGIKITRSRDVKVTDSAILRNQGNGLWFDESVYDATVTGNDVIGNTGH
ncbi:MAG: right-handed parallel beta-helix repeat-containing protein, partial [Williamsia herbipolensis]|nr:right-handed parallel beta-helix repeat-containing protein [Williamsia herbipolensis]